MTIELIYQDEKSNKFWKITVEGNQHIVTYGRVGTDGTSKTKTFVDEAAALKDAQKLIAAKKKKGYVETARKAKIIRDSYTLAGKPIKKFGATFNPNTAVKVSTDSYEDDDPSVIEKLEKLANLPNINELDTLVIGEWKYAGEEEDSRPSIEKLIELKDAFSGLKHLFVGDMSYESCEISWIQHDDFSHFYQYFPNLETFGIKGIGGLKLGKIQLPKLKNLIIECGGLPLRTLKEILSSDLPNLEYLEIWLGTEYYGLGVTVDDLQPILDGHFPKLYHLGLKNYDFQDELAKRLHNAPVLKNLKTLDFSMGILKDEGAQALYHNDALLRLEHINCRHHYISDEWQKKLKERYTTQNINLKDYKKPDEDYFYVEVGE